MRAHLLALGGRTGLAVGALVHDLGGDDVLGRLWSLMRMAPIVPTSGCSVPREIDSLGPAVGITPSMHGARIHAESRQDTERSGA